VALGGLPGSGEEASGEGVEIAQAVPTDADNSAKGVDGKEGQMGSNTERLNKGEQPRDICIKQLHFK